MQNITARHLREAKWAKVYEYDGSSMSFKTFACEALQGLTVTKEQRKVRGRIKTTTIFSVHGRKTDSPTQAVRYWNEHAKKLKGQSGGPDAANGTQPAGRPRPKGTDLR